MTVRAQRITRSVDRPSADRAAANRAAADRAYVDRAAANRGSGGQRRQQRILISTDTYPPDVNGAGYFTYRLATGLAERGHDVHVVCASAAGHPRVERENGVTVHRLRSASVLVHPTMRTAVPLGVTKTVARIVERLDPHVVHAQGHFIIGRAAIRAARAAGTPVVLTNHFMPENLFAYAHLPEKICGFASSLAWRDMVRVAYEADHVTTPTDRAAQLLTSQGFARPVESVSCGIDLHRFHPCPEERRRARERFGLPDKDTMVFVGRLDEEKRIEDLIQALPRVLDQHDLQLALVGTGQRQPALRRLAEALGVADRVHFLGFIPDEDLPMTYTAADLFAIGGVAELQSIATLEAMSSGLPVVAADAMALPHLVTPGRNGYLYQPGDVSELSRHLLSILRSPERRQAMGAASREIAQGHDHQRSLERFERIYAEVQPAGTPAQSRRGSVATRPKPRRRPLVAA